MKSAAIITAAGSGTRMGAGKNKILLPLQDQTVIEMATQAFSNPDKFQKIIITYSKDDKKILQKLLRNISVPIDFVEGGSSRQESVYNGLKSLKNDCPQFVLIHDGARPWVSAKLIEEILCKTATDGNAVPVIPSVNAMKKINSSGHITEHLKRDKTVSAQTPQGFIYKNILKAHELANLEGFSAIDDTELWDKYFGKVSTIAGEVANIKITYKKDMENL